MSNQLTPEQFNEKHRVTYNVVGNEISLTPSEVKQYFANGADISITEYKMFAELCRFRGLNPFLKEAYCIKYGNQPAQIVVGKDAVLKNAIKNPNYNGRKQGIIIQKENGEVEYRKGTFKLPNEILVGGWAEVYRKDVEHSTYITVSFDEVAQRTKTGDLNSNWAKKGATMVEKVALVRALRETFVEDLGGMVDENEVWNQEEMQNPIIQQEEPTIIQNNVETLEPEYQEIETLLPGLDDL